MAKLERVMRTSSVICLLAACICVTLGKVVIEPNVEEKFVKDGATQELNCSANGPTDKGPKLSWSDVPNLDGVTRESKTQTKQNQSVIQAKLTVDQFKAANSGQYTCTYEDSQDSTTSYINLIHVKETKTEPTYYAANTSATLGCSIEAGGRTVRSVEWLKAGQPVSGRLSTDANDQLVISNPVHDDVGVYTARFTLDRTSIPYDCEVSYKEEELNIVPKKTEAEYMYGNATGTLACSINVGGRRIKNVEWLKNGTAVSRLKEHKRFEEFPSNYSLVIREPTRDDAGVYTARFTIEGIPEAYDCDVTYKSEPFVLPFDKSKNLIQEDDMELQCRVKGYPKAKVRWYKDNKPINASMGEDKRIELKPLNGYENARLIISKVGFDDEGNYTCEAHSEFFGASDSKSITVRVKDKLAALWPFLGIVGEVIILCVIIFIYEKRRNKQAEQEDNAAQEIKNGEKHTGVRHRGSKK